MKGIDKTWFDFLWDKKPHKIANKVIIKPKNQTGLAMVDIYTKNKALNIALIRRLVGECRQDR